MATEEVIRRVTDMWSGFDHTARADVEMCIVCPKAYPLFDSRAKGVIGGGETDMYYLATELAKDKAFGIHVVCGDYGQPTWQVKEKVWLWNWGCRSLFVLWRLMKWIDADIYLCKSMSWGVPLVFLYCKVHHKKFAYRLAHNWECDGTFRCSRSILHWLFMRCLKKADVIFAQTHDQKEMLCGRR